MAQMNIEMSVRFAWWALPLAKFVAYAALLFVGADRAIELAGSVAVKGMKISTTAAAST